MEVMDPVHGMIEIKEDLVGIVTSDLFNRLRNISQLGTVQYIFPGANHSRYSHSLGVYHLGCRLVDKIKSQVFSEHCFKLKGGLDRQEKNWETIENSFLAACLLHDLGHLPFSHSLHKQYENLAVCKMALFKEAKHCDYFDPVVFESISDQKCNHEVVGLLLLATILDKEQDIDPFLLGFFLSIPALNKTLSNNIQSISKALFKNVNEGLSIFEILAQYVSGCFDLDKMDYLIRDSLFTGVPISLDIDLIFNSLELRKISGKTQISYPRRMGLILDQFIYARLLMYNQVYFHPKNIVLERIISDIVSKDYKFFDTATPITQFTSHQYKALTDSTILCILFRNEGYKNIFLNHHHALTNLITCDSTKHDNPGKEREVRKLQAVKSSNHRVYVGNKKWDFDTRLLKENAEVYRIVNYKPAA